MANAIASVISSVREVVIPAPATVEASNASDSQPPQESPFFGQKLKNFCKKYCLKIILLILLVGFTSGLGRWIGTSFANTALLVCKPNIHCKYVMPEKSYFEFYEEDVELQSKKFISEIILCKKALRSVDRIRLHCIYYQMPRFTTSLLRENCKDLERCLHPKKDWGHNKQQTQQRKLFQQYQLCEKFSHQPRHKDNAFKDNMVP